MGGETLAAARPEVDAFELAGTGMLVTDGSALVLRANRAYCDLIGRREAELLGHPFLHAFPRASQPLVRRALKVALTPDALPMASHWTLTRRDGRSVAVLLTMRATGGDRPLAVITVTDVTQLAATEARLTAVLEEQRLILEHAQVGILFSRSGRIMRANAACAEMFGFAEAELVGQPTTVLVPAIDGTEPPGGEPWHAELEVRRRDGGTFWCELDGQPFGAAGEPLQSIWTLRDVTERRHAQDALARALLDQHAAQEAVVQARDELEHRVVERTRDLADKNVELEVEVAERRQAEEQLRVRNERLLYHRNQLLALARRDHADLGESLRDILASACTTLRLERASFWRMLADGRAIRCELVHRADGAADPAPAPDTIAAADHPAYFGAIVANEVVAAEDAASHPATHSLEPAYLRPLGITATLDVPIWLDGRVVGLVCCETTRGPRVWQPEEIDFASGIATMIALAIEASQRVDAEARLLRLAHYDSLTGLPNRNLLADRLRQALAFAARHRTRVALLFLDLDRFKTINDSLGHHVGDQILKEVAARLTRMLRAGDTVARLGGDEFVIVLQEVREPSDAATVAQNLLRELAPGYLVDGRELHASASVGITLFPDDGRDAEVLMKNADVAMYHVKDTGRNGFQFFAAPMNQQANRRLAIENDLRLAIRRGELALRYQPQVGLARRDVLAVEALVRWRHPEHGLLLPDEFVGIAEESGLAQALGEWTLHEACGQSRRWQAAGLPPVPVAVNLSARAFRERTLPADLAAILRDTGLEPRLLELEITESAVMQQSDTTLETLSELSAMGVQLSVDDFGTGYSSLAYLKRFPIDKLKIDRSFVGGIPADGEDVAIAQAILSLAKTLGLQVVAEGVENDDQLGFLVAHGCDLAQGNLFCPACDAADTGRIFAPGRRPAP